MNKKIIKRLIIFVMIVFLLSIPLIIFNNRAPVLIVTDEIFIEIYGAKRLESESFRGSLTLFRNIKIVKIVDDISDDLIPFSVEGISEKPYCVVFPSRYGRSAMLYHESNPDIRVIVLEGRNFDMNNLSSTALEPNIFRYRTDLEADFYRAGYIAGSFSPPAPKTNESEETAAVIAEENQKRSVVFFMDSQLYQLGGQKLREIFQEGINKHENPAEIKFFTSFSDFSGNLGLSCVVLAGSGSEYLNNKSGVPVLVFSWLDPILATSDVAMLIDDSPLAQVVQAVKMADSGATEGFIKSRFIVMDIKKGDKQLLRRIKESS